LALGAFFLTLPLASFAQTHGKGTPATAATPGVPTLGTPGVNCVISAVNRNAIVETDASYTVFNIPANAGAFRGRVTCSDGSVGQTAVKFSSVVGGTTIELGAIVWGKIDPVPTALGLTAPEKRLTTGGSSQLSATAIGINPDNSATTYNVTPRSAGTTYTISNDLLGTVSEDGLVKILAGFAPGSTSRVVLNASAEGGATGSYMFFVGPRGSLSGRVLGADGITPIANAQVTVLRTQPREQVGTVVTDAAGNFTVADVNAGPFQLTAIDPSNGDRAIATARIETEGQAGSVNLRMNGQGTVDVTVVSVTGTAPNEVLTPVPNAQVTLTALGAFLDTRTAASNATGLIRFLRVAAGDFTVSTRDRASGLVGTTLGVVAPGVTTPVTLRLQPVGTIQGIVFDASNVNGSTPRADIQVRVISRERGIVTQGITDANGAFSFSPLPLSDGPYTLDAFADGRLRARVPGLVLNAANQVLAQNITLSGVGTVSGVVLSETRQPVAGALVTLQMTEGQRFAYEVSTDAQGRFALPAILLGSYTLTAGKDSRSARLNGRLSVDGETQTVEIQLGGATVTGIVYERNATTPVGAGTKVYLVPSGRETLTIDAVQSGAGSTTTDAQGRYVLAIPTVGRYTIQAERLTDRGRAELAATTLNPGQPYQANVVFLAKGAVSGVVKDPSGNVQANVVVTVTSNGAFRNSWSATTNAAGQYVIPGVFAGELIAFAQNTTTGLAGYATNRMLAEGQALTVDITLAATGTLSGQVLKRNGSVVPGAIKLELQLRGAIIATQEVANGSAYQFVRVPTIDEVTVTATEIATGDKGLAKSRIETANQSKTLNVQLVGQGAVKVIAVDETGVRIAGADVTVATTTPFYARLSGTTDVNGLAVLAPVFAGDFTVNVSKTAQVGTRAGAASGTLLADTEKTVTVTLTSRPLGTIKGVVFKPDGVTPESGVLVRMTPEPSFGVFTRSTNALGQYQFDQVEGGNTYTLQVKRFDNASCPQDRIRGQVAGVTITTNNEIVVRNVTMFAAGRVFGKLTDSQGVGVAGMKVSLSNPDPTFGLLPLCYGTGGRYEAVSNDVGNYALEDMPAGNFTVTAQNAALTQRAEGAGRVRFETDNVELNMAVVGSAVAMPQTLHDANAMPFDIRGDGSIGSGKNNIFTGIGPDARGMRLSIITNNIPVPFLNGDGSVGRSSASGQQIELDEANASGLKVTRKIFVPKVGYFARYLEVLENTTTNPITVGVKIITHHSQSNSNPRVVDSSDGDQVLSVASAANRDRWVIVDDQEDADPFKSGSEPATGHLFDGAPSAVVGAPAVKNVNTADYELVGQTGKLTLQWDGVTVAPGQKAILMHFAFNQLDRYRARQAALRLAQLPPEAIDNLSADERTAILNFAIPADGVSTQLALPAVDVAVISGKVVSADGTTPIANARVHLKSMAALYGRDYYVNADNSGNYELRANTNGTASAVAIPLFSFNIDATHPKTGADTGFAQADFVAPATTVVKNLIFNNTGNVRGVVRRHNGALVGDADVRLCEVANAYRCLTQIYNYDTTKANGSYLMAGSRPRDYGLHAGKTHPQQGGGLPILGQSLVTITSGDTAVVDITMEPTGTLTGVVRAANGDPVQNVSVRLFYVSALRGSEFARLTTTDTAGRYRFFDVRAGNVAIDVTDPVTQARGEAAGAVVVDAEATVDATLRGFGTIAVQVNYARGVAATNSRVTIQNGSIYTSGQTDTNGLITFNAAVGTYSVTAWHPDDVYQADLSSTGTATVAAQGSSAAVTVTLKPAGVVRGTVIRPDGSTLASGFPYTIKPLGSSAAVTNGSSRTEATGNYRFSPLKLGTWVITAYDPVLDRFADAEFVVAADGAEVTVDLRLEDNRIALPATLKDANRFPYDVQQDGKLATGMVSDVNAFKNASLLEINGVAFTGDTSAVLEATKRQFAITQPTLIQGLKVTRKVFVPKGGYFARYLEVFENASASPITVDAKLTHGLPASTVLLSSSSGDAALTTADTWITTDDAKDGDPLIDPQQTSTAFLFGQTGANVTASQAAFAAAATGTDKAATLRWQSITVPANGKVVLMHFAVQQINRAGATAAVERLQQLPPEALVSLTASEVASIKNFTVPANAVSVVTPLPALTAGVNGRVFEGDARTPVVGVRVTVQSSHALFNRVWGMQPDPSPPCVYIPGTALPFQVGNNNIGSISSAPLPNAVPPVLGGTYRMNGQLTNDDSVAMPEGVATTVRAQAAQSCFNKYSGHSWTNLPSKIHTVNPSVEQNIVFDSGVLTGTITGYNDFSVTGGRMYLSTDNIEYPDYHYITLGTDGTYVYPGLAPGSYDVLADTQHPQATARDLRGSRSGSVVTLGQITATDLQLQPAGSVQGAISTANGEPSVNALVEIRGVASGQTYDQCATGCVPQTLAMHKGKRDVNRSVRTDSLGRYNFSAIPTGSYTLTITDPISDGRKTVSFTVTEGQVVVQNVTLLGLGAINLTVTKGNGAPLVEAIVYIFPAAQAAEEVAGRTNAQGKLSIANTPTGAFTIRVPDARFPGDTFFERKLTGSIATNGESQTLTIAMKAVASVAITVRNTDTNQVVASAPVWITDTRGTQRFVGNTDATGQVTATAVPEGAFRLTVTANAPGSRTFAKLGAVAALDDGATVNALVSVTASVDQLGELRFEGERRLYSVNANAGETLRVSAFGEARAPAPLLIRTRITVYDAVNVVVASGYRSDGQGYNQSDVGNLDNIVASANTTYTIAVQSDIAIGDYALGAYRVTADINAATSPVVPFVAGTVQGVITRANGNPAVNWVIEIQTAAPLALRTRVTTDANGNYRFEGVPAGAATIRALNAGGATIASQSVNLATAATVVTQNIALPAISQLTITVKLANGSNAPLDTRVDVTDALGLVTLRTNLSGQVVTEITGDASAKAFDPATPSNTLTKTISAVDGSSLALEIAFGLEAGRISGRLLNADGSPNNSQRVELSYADGSRYLGSQYANANGEFIFTNVFEYNVPLKLSAREPVTNRDLTYEFTLPIGGGKSDIELRFPATGTITGRVTTASGEFPQGVSVCARYAISNGEESQVCATTIVQGTYTLTSVPVGTPLVVSARIYINNSDRVEAIPLAITLSNAVQPFVAPDLVLNGARITASALPRGSLDNLYLQIRDLNDNFVAGGRLSDMPQLSRILPFGTWSVSLRKHNFAYDYDCYYSSECTKVAARTVNIESSLVNVQLKEHAIAGTVKWPDGTVVTSGSLFVAFANGTPTNVPLGASGDYVFNTYAEGLFDATVTDYTSRITTTVNGMIAPASDDVTLNIVMPATATVNGTVRTAAGLVVPNVQITVKSSGLAFERYTTTDGNGQYRVERVALGSVTVSTSVKACPENQPYSDACEYIPVATATANATAVNSLLTIDLQTPVGAAVRGRMMLNDGTYVEQVAPVVLASKVGNLYVSYVGTTQPDGSYAFVDLLPGVVTVSINADGVTGNSPAVVSGKTTATTVTGQETIINLAPVVVFTQYAYYYGWRSSYSLGNLQIHCRAEVGEGDYYQPTFALSEANYHGYECTSPVALSFGGRQLEFPAITYPDSKIRRKIYVEPNDRFARVYDEFENTTASPITLNVAIGAQLGGTELASVASTQGRYWTVDYSGPNSASMVFCGVAPQTGCPATTSASGSKSLSWNITLAPGEKRAIINYVVKAADSQSTQLIARSSALAAGTEPNMFDALSANERARVVNFTITP
jgi:Carboxypeptidase regulatory-like domain